MQEQTYSHTPVKWTKWDDSIILEGQRELTSKNCSDEFQLVTTNVEVGGADGPKSGYFEVELTEDSSEVDDMDFEVGMYRPGLDHSDCTDYRSGDGFILCAASGGSYRLPLCRRYG